VALSRAEKLALLKDAGSAEGAAPAASLTRAQKIALLQGGAPPEEPAGPNRTGMEALLPRATREGASPAQKTIGAGLDALSLPGRLAAASTDQPVEPFAYAGASNMPKEGAFTPEGGQKFLNSAAETEGKTLPGKIIRDPALIPSLATGGAVGAGVKALGLTGLGAASAAGGVLGAESAAIHQADNASQGKKVSLGSAAAETVTGAALPVAAAGVGAVAKWTNGKLGKLAEGLSGVSEEALRVHGAGFGQGAKDLAQAAGKQGEIGKNLVDALDNLDDFLPEKAAVDRALKEIPAVNISNTLGSLEKAKTGGVLSSSRATNEKIDGLIKDIAGAADETGNIPAEKFRAIRKEIDELVGDAFGKESGKFVTALKQARHQMASDLVESAKVSGHPEYVEAMQSMADKLQKADKLSSFLGKSATTRENRAESFVSNLFGKNKAERQEAVKAMGEIFGEDFLQQSKLASLAAELGPEGKAGILPRQLTGRAALGPLLAGASGHFVTPGAGVVPLALSSPRLAGATLSLSDQAANLASNPRLQGVASSVGRAGLRPIFRELGNQNP
jgi:hypothetical protein